MDIRENTVIGEALRNLRVGAGVTQKELAKRLNKPQSYISKIEMGERSLRLYELFTYSKALQMSPIDIVSEIQHHLPKEKPS